MYKLAFAAYTHHVPWDEDASWYGEDPQRAWDECPKGAWLLWAASFGPRPVSSAEISTVVRDAVTRAQPHASGLPVYYRALNTLVDGLANPDGYLAIQRDELVSIHPEEAMVPRHRHAAWQWEQAVLDATAVVLGDRRPAYSAVWHAEAVLPHGQSLAAAVRRHLPEQRFTKE